MIIKPYEESYRDDLIFMVLQAKDALGRKPTINEDLLDIKGTILTAAICSGSRSMKRTELLAVSGIPEPKILPRRSSTDCT